MSLDEVARWAPEKQEATASADRTYHWHNFRYEARAARTVENNTHSEGLDKARWQTAVRDAKERGLDWTEGQEQAKEARARNFSKARRHPAKHTEILLKETSLSFQEIAEITGLDLFQVVTIKLKLRDAA